MGLHQYYCCLSFTPQRSPPPLPSLIAVLPRMETPESRKLGGQLRFRPSSVLVLFLVFFLAGRDVRSDPKPGDCEPMRCGDVDGPNISYPFAIRHVQPPYCGYPGFEVSCEDDGRVVTDVGSEYYVNNIFYHNKSLIISSRNPCPRHNLSLARTPFNISLINQRLFFYLNCTHRLPGYREISCGDDENGRASFVTEHPVQSNHRNASEFCHSVFNWPFLAAGAGSGGNYSDLLRNGFLLEWKAPDCSICESSGGRCGYNQTTDQFMCICWDRVHRVRCEGSRRRYKIIVGVCAGAGGFLLASLCFFLYRRRKMAARSGSSTLLFRSTSSGLSTKKDPEMGSAHYPTPHFSYEELHEATDGFSASNELGDGGFGTVYKGKLRDGRIVAVKRLYENNYKRVDQFKNEVDILNLLRHQNLVTLYGCTSRHCRELLLVYEYVSNGTVADHLHGNRAEEGALTWPVRLNIAVETATALAYLHAVDPQIIHRDVKTNNILLDNNFHVKVADFGLSRLFPADVTHVSTAPQGTPGYVDPEYHQCYQLTDKSDVYSFGVVLVELISSKPAVDITRHRHEINLANLAINKIQNGALHEMVDPALEFEADWEVRRMIKLVAELAFRCLQAEKEMRPSMEDVVEVLRGIQSQDEAGRMAAADHGAADDTTLLKTHPPVSPDTVMDKWASRTTTPNTSA